MGGAERSTLADGSEALRWADGEYGVVLVADAGEYPPTGVLWPKRSPPTE